MIADDDDLPCGLVGPALDMRVPGALEAFMAEQDAMYAQVEADAIADRLEREKAEREAAE